MRHRRFKEIYTSMDNNISKHNHLWNTKVFQKNVGPSTIVYQNTIMYETQKLFKKM